jgi:heme/copper-type cytochrome/quinol oxidase subunit 1
MTASSQVRAENRVVIAHIYTATAAIALGAIFGVFQGFARTGAFGAPGWFDYYRILTMHGVLMALVFTTFFITGLSLFVTYRSIPRERKLAAGWFGWLLMLAGTTMAALTILRGDATVLYTFYTPLKASPWFYIGATLLVLGTWVVAFEVFENVNFYRKNQPGRPVPLVVFCSGDVRHVDRSHLRGSGRNGFTHSMGFRLDAGHQRDADADIILVFRSPACVLLDHGCVHHLVQHHPVAIWRQRI